VLAFGIFGRLKQRRLVAAFALLATALAAAGCGSSGGDGTGEAQGGGEPFKFGAVIPLTGAYSQYGEFMESGLKEGVRRVNEEGGILGRQVELVTRDDGGDPGQGRLAAQQLKTQEDVDFVYADVISGIAFAILPYTTSQKEVTFTNGATPGLGDPEEFPYSFQYNDLAPERVVAVSSALKQLGGTKVGILVSTNPPQEALGQGLQADLPSKYDMEVAGLETFAVDARDLTAQLQRLRAAGADALAFDGAGNDNVATVMAGMETLGWDVPVVSEPAALHGNLNEQVPPSVADQFYAVQFRIGTRTGEDVPQVAEYIEDLKEYGEITNLVYSAIATDTVFLTKWAFETAEEEIGNTDADSLRSTLEGIGEADFPEEYSLALGNPMYTEDVHTTANADYCTLWGLIRTSELVDGQYEGEYLDTSNVDPRCQSAG